MGFIILLFSSACVPQQEYDKAKSELTAAQTKIVSLQNQVDALRNQVSMKDDALKSAQDKLSQAHTRIGILLWYFYDPGAANMGNNTTMYFNMMRGLILSSNDQALKDNFKIATDAGTQDAFGTFWKYMWESTIDIFKTPTP